jgi:hypothetical protein
MHINSPKSYKGLKQRRYNSNSQGNTNSNSHFTESQGNITSLMTKHQKLCNSHFTNQLKINVLNSQAQRQQNKKSGDWIWKTEIEVWQNQLQSIVL